MIPKTLRSLADRLRALFRTRALDADLDEEIRAHLEMAEEEYMARGLTREESRRKARRDFGGVEQVKERHREGRAFVGLRDLVRDVRVSARGLLKRPGYTTVVVGTLALGIGAITTVYSVVDGVLIRPLPYDDPATLVAVGNLEPGALWLDQATGLQNLAPISFPNFLDLRDRSRSFDELAAILPFEETLDVPGGDPETLRIAGVTPGLFDMLDAVPSLGRSFLPEEYVASPEAVVLSHGAWQRRYGGDPEIVGRPLEIEGVPPGTIVGVLPEDFRPPEAFFGPDEAPEFWLPFWDSEADSRRQRNLLLIGRLSRDASVEQARVEADRIAADLAREFPEDNRQDADPLGIGVNALHEQTTGTAASGLGLFLGAAGLLLLLSAMNAATLLLARALDRTQELRVRSALGARRARDFRVLLSEAGLLAIAGGVLGVLVAYAGVGAFLRFAPPSIPRLEDVAVDLRVLSVAAAISLGAGLVTGLLPALRLARGGLFEGFQGAGRGFSESSSRLRNVLVGGQLAMAVVLLSGAALLFGSFVGMRGADLGFEHEGLYVLGVQIRQGAGLDPDAPWASWDELRVEVEAIPGVEAVALASEIPLRRSDWEPRLLLPGDGPEVMRRGIAGYAVTPDFLDVMGTELRAGRGFERTDRFESERVALVNESFIRTQLGGADPLGVVIQWAFREDFRGRRQLERLERWFGEVDQVPIRIVGVVEDVVQVRVADGPRPAIYVPYTQARAFSPRAMVRSALSPEAVLPELRGAAQRYFPAHSQPVLEVGAMSDRLGPDRPTLRFQTLLVGAFALIATLLAAAGLYGALAHSVGRRRREFGVRMAIGAHRGTVLRMVLGEGIRLSLVSLGVGLLATLVTARLLRSFLFGIDPYDPTTLLSVAAVMLFVSALACVVPARRATAVDPVAVLKSE